MKWYCNDCQEYFEEEEVVEKVVWEHSDYYGHGGYFPEKSYQCPHCGSEDICECEKCDGCGEEVVETICFGHKTHLCDACRKEVETKLEELRDYVQCEFDINDYREAERVIEDILDDLF